MTQDQIEESVRKVLNAQKAIKELKELGLLRDSYQPVIDAALNTALRSASNPKK